VASRSSEVNCTKNYTLLYLFYLFTDPTKKWLPNLPLPNFPVAEFTVYPMEYSFLAARLSFTFDMHMYIFFMANKLCCCRLLKLTAASNAESPNWSTRKPFSAPHLVTSKYIATKKGENRANFHADRPHRSRGI